jgi:hypothetical protein
MNTELFMASSFELGGRCFRPEEEVNDTDTAMLAFII